MKTIQLTRGKEATVDEDWYEMLSQVSWHCSVHGYAVSSDNEYMHHLILETDQHRDHINRNKLDNRKENLRPTCRSGNNRNRPNFVGNYKGVHHRKDTGKWYAQISVASRNIYLGQFDCAEDAAHAYNAAARQYHGEYAYINEVD